jgi:hypothetical protein
MEKLEMFEVDGFDAKFPQYCMDNKQYREYYDKCQECSTLLYNIRKLIEFVFDCNTDTYIKTSVEQMKRDQQQLEDEEKFWSDIVMLKRKELKIEYFKLIYKKIKFLKYFYIE